MFTGLRLIVLFVATCSAGWGGHLMLANGGWWFVAGGVLLGVGLYVIRDAGRMFYAAAEIIFALFLLWKTSTAGKGDFSDDFGPDFSHDDLGVIVLQSMAAVYVLIRGLDNLTKGLGWPKEGWYLRLWSNER